jgi:RimJ/RimL family protein N-acetyltransferase
MKSGEVEKAFGLITKGESAQIGKNVNIRLIKMEDFNPLVKMLNNPAANKFLFYAPAPAEAFEGFFNPMIEAAALAIKNNTWPDAACLIIENDDGDFLGNIGLAQNPFLSGNLEIGFHIEPSAWGKGIATLVASFTIDIAFNHLDVYKLCADCYGSNTGSVKVLEKVGFLKEGCQKGYYNNEDDKLIFGLTKNEYSQY